MMGVEASETCWATHKCQVMNLRNCCIWLVNLFETYKIVVCFLLGDSPAFEFYKPTFRNTLSV
jgi:hypothetical protein